MNKKLASFSSLDSIFPLKAVKNKKLMNNIIMNNKIIPIHIRINITNKCNQNCKWCCRQNVDRELEMSYETIENVAKRYKALGSQAITISGGGEPLMHRDINKVIGTISDIGLRIGILTNGWFLPRITLDNLNKVTWIRISVSDELKEKENQYWEILTKVLDNGNEVDWGLSHVVTSDLDLELIRRIILFANNHNCTHVRLVSNISDSDNLVNTMETIKQWLKIKSVNDTLVIYQNRTHWEQGEKDCWVGLLRPIIDTDGYIYGCCATGDPKRDYVHSMALGTVNDIEKIFNEQIPINGLRCKKCYHYHYNAFLNLFNSSLKHEEFI